MTKREAEQFVDGLMSAIDDYSEATAALEQARSEYTGYSPGYALAPWYERQEKSRDELGRLFMPLLMAAEPSQPEGMERSK